MERGAKFVGSSGGVGIASTAKEAEMRIGRGSAKEGEERSEMIDRLGWEAVQEVGGSVETLNLLTSRMGGLKHKGAMRLVMVQIMCSALLF